MKTISKFYWSRIGGIVKIIDIRYIFFIQEK